MSLSITPISAALLSCFVGEEIAPFSVVATGGTAPYSFEAEFLPLGIELSSAGLFSGVPSQVGSFDTIITVTDSTGASVKENADFTVMANVTVNPNNYVLVPSFQKWTVGVPLANGPLVAYPAPGNDLASPFVYSALGVPDGISMSGSGVFSGTPLEPQEASTIVVKITDSNGIVIENGFDVVVTVNAADAVTHITDPVLTVQRPSCGVASFGPIPNTSLTELIAAATSVQQAIYPK